MTNYTFADGTFIPQGSYVSTSAVATHYDAAHYTDATTFAPWRFVGGRDGAARSQMIDTGLDYLPFGHGRHVWCVHCSSSAQPRVHSYLQPGAVLCGERAEDNPSAPRRDVRRAHGERGMHLVFDVHFSRDGAEPHSEGAVSEAGGGGVSNWGRI